MDIFLPKILKSDAKKIAHLFCSVDQEPSLLMLKWITKGQNNLFQALKWGVVRLCSLNIFGDTSINVKILFLQFFEFCKIWRIFLSKSGNLEIIAFLCLVISLDQFELERRTIPHFKARNKSLWPLFLWNYSEGCCYQVISKIKCPIFFAPDLSKTRAFFEFFCKFHGSRRTNKP